MAEKIKALAECQKCGACCRGLIIQIGELDLIREPRLRPVAELCDGNGRIKFEDDMEKEYLLACGEKMPCPFLKDDNTCEIYPTRPNVCVAMEVGGEQCKRVRKQKGLFK